MENDAWPKNIVLIAEDSILKNINERTFSKKFNTYFHSFPGTYVRDLVDYLKPVFEKNPGKIILVIVANDVECNSPLSMISDIKSLIQFIHNLMENCHFVISEIFKHTDKKT